MFKLQRLEITGFKSFADYTEIVFTGNGITAVVGPNGCGKSNVSDCISWVLGEQRAKTLRGAEMKDVVFQGTKNRKPSGMAEVVLHLVRDEDAFDADDAELEEIDETLSSIDELAVDVDELETQHIQPDVEAIRIEENGFHEAEFEIEKVQAAQVGSIQTVERTIKTKRHWRPRSFALDFAPGEAVSVTRRLYLSGESEYELNGKTCRLRDIQDLFAGTGLSGAHYAIIEQGRIGQILSAKPADRRNLIEEAAGISKFRTRQRAAETRLDTAKTNLGRISDIVSEIEKQANSLRRQAAKTRRFIVLQDEFRVLLRQLFSAEGLHLSSLITELDGKFAAAIDVEKSFVEKVAAKEEDFKSATQKARDTEEALAEIRRQHAHSALERDRADREHRYQSEQIVNLNNRSEALRLEISTLTERLKLAETELSRLKTDEEKESFEAAAAEKVLLEAEGLFAAKADDVRKIEIDLEERRSELLQHTAAVERFAEIERQLTLNRERLVERTEGLVRERERADESHAEHIADAERLVAELAADKKRLDALLAEKKEILESAAAARETLRRAEEARLAIQHEFSRKKNRLDTLQELEEKRAVYAPEVQKLFAEQDNIGVKLNGVLADFLNVEPRAEKAVEVLFGGFLQTVLVANAADAKKVSGWLAGSESGRIATLIANDELKAKKKNIGGSRIEDLIGVSDELRGTLREIFPREMSAELVDDLDGFHPSNSGILVNTEGDMLVGGKLFVSGNAAADEKNASLLAFKRELSGLAAAVGELEVELSNAETKSNTDRRDLIDLEEKTVDLQSLIIKVERGIVALEMQEKSIRQDIERAERHKKVVAEEIVHIKAEIDEIDARVVEAGTNSQEAKRLQSDIKKSLESISEMLANARSVSEAENAVLNQKRTLAATSSERRRSVQAARRRVENEEKELESRIALQNLEISEIDSKIEHLRTSVAGIADRIAMVDDDQLKESEELQAAIEAVRLERERADATSGELADLNRRSVEAANDRATIEVRQAEAVTNLRNISENCTQELNISLAELIESEPVAEGFGLDASRERADDLRQRLDGFGAINMLAVEELGEAEERLLFLTSQRQDIIDSIRAAEEALREIKERSREKFRHAFDAINENFVEFFRELFGGGRGEMSMLESDDILEAGIEVVAQPPGKRLQNILLLSGGEKAMTAIALVLAIFKYRPSPFCLLDEVDAPLDDANVGRFVTKIAEMSEKTQFIVITHNKRTMEAARALYGVTMQEAGVSKVVSVRFE